MRDASMPVHEETARPHPGAPYLRAFALVLLGYAVFGRSFAYLGIPPLYVGEMMFATGAALFLLRRTAVLRIHSIPLIRLLLVFIGWNVICTVPYYPIYGLDSVRDAATWYYSGFAIIVVGLMMANPALFRFVLAMYRSFATWYPALIGAALLLRLSGALALSTAKTGDVGVHLAGVLAFKLAQQTPVPPLWWLTMSFPALYVVSGNRGGTLAFLMSFVSVALLQKRLKRLIALTVAVAAILLILAFVAFEVQRGSRSISPRQVVENLESMSATDRTVGGLQSTARWRLLWWSKIVSYTVFGDYFWTGKGYGINLADSDGFQVVGPSGPPLRSPHNGHLTLLARSGVPGFLLWCAVQIAWGVTMLRHYLNTRRRAAKAWSKVFLWLLAYWIAFLVNGAFDVFLEGPMGGIWFWFVFGMGLSSIWLYRRYPDLLDRPLPDLIRVRSRGDETTALAAPPHSRKSP